MRKTAFCAAVAVSLCTTSAHALITLTITKVGNDAQITGGGSLDLTGLTEFSFAAQSGSINPTYAVLALAPVAPDTGNLQFYYALASTPDTFGTGGNTNLTSNTGDYLLIGQEAILGVPNGYVSGESLTFSAVAPNYDSLGLIPGTYEWVLPSADTISLSIVAPVPEPSSVALWLGLACGVGFFWRRRRRLAVD